VAARVRVGTCSFADDALTQHWYPPGVRSSEQRLRYYADHFETTEVDSTFYRLPSEETTTNWAARTPDGFVFHIKAFAPMTRHPVKLEQLPLELHESLEVDERGRVDRMHRDVRGEIFRLFREAIAPLAEAGRLGGILLQLAPYVVYRDRSLEYLEWARQQLPDVDLLVEFRHVSWLDDEHRTDTLAFLEQHRLTNVVVDAPRSEAKNLIPTVVALTSPTAYVRMHGRNAATWNVRGGSASDRFDYLYSEDELREWVEPLRELSRGAEQAYVLFNNNRWSPSADDPHRQLAQAPQNAQLLASLLRDSGVSV
jgi:uncharacterized protein YecE (DUF72 family)